MTDDVSGSTAMAGLSADVIVVGDGPAGSALAAAITHRTHRDVLLVGPDQPWQATYSAWADEIEGNPLVPDDVWAQRVETIDVRAHRTRTLDRAYGVLDNERLRAHLRDGVRHVRGVVERTEDLDAELIVDATGWPSRLGHGPVTQGITPDWQIAYGVVVASPPEGALGRPMLMDFSDPFDGADGDQLEVTTFGYALPVDDGWLVEETVLVGPDIEPSDLRPRLAARLGLTFDALADAALRVEEVRIPMGAPMSAPGHPVAFGAGAGLIHPATGYSVAGSLAAAIRVADEIARSAHTGSTSDDLARTAHDAIWADGRRRTRRFHEYGLDVLTNLDDESTRDFFDVFFQLELSDQAAYLSVDSTPRRIARVMTTMFARAPWSLRRRLAGGDPRGLLRVLRP